jgi:hypothetical protein
MATCIQLDLFETNDPVSLLQKDFRLLDKKCQNVQRGLFARFATVQEEMEALRDICYQLRHELDTLKEEKVHHAEIIEIHKGKR